MFEQNSQKEKISIIGKGSYGKVVLVRKKSNNKLYAMKVVKKKILKRKKQFLNILTEKEILINQNNQFLVKMDYSFQTDNKLYFILEYCAGGDLYNLITKINLKEHNIRFYISQIVLALECLHLNNIIYRDLKPENVIIDQQGYIKLTDFGLSKYCLKDKTYSMCGTPEYQAPEIIENKGYDRMVDQWSLGCIIYEMATNSPPFMANDSSQLERLIQDQNPFYPNHLSVQIVDLLKQLLQKDPKQRIDLQQIKQHMWFNQIDFDKIKNREYIAPFIPKLKTETDVQYFDSEFTGLQIVDSPRSQISVLDNESIKDIMMGFSYDKSCLSNQKLKNSDLIYNDSYQEEQLKHDQQQFHIMDDQSSFSSGYIEESSSCNEFYLETNNQDLNSYFKN